MLAPIATTLVNLYPGGLLLCAFTVVAVLVIGAACNVLLRLSTTGFEGVVYAAATGVVAIAAMGVCVASAGQYRHLVAMILLYGGLGSGLTVFLFNRRARSFFMAWDRWDGVAFVLYLVFVSLCFGISYLPIRLEWSEIE